MKEIYCPITQARCRESKCGWYNDEYRTCGVVAIPMLIKE
jgi:hypothetical protein